MKPYKKSYALASLFLPLLFAGPQAPGIRAQAKVNAAASPREVAPALATRERVRRVAPLRASDARDGGARVIVTSDAPLSDYSAFRRGEEFCVRIPRAEAAEVGAARAASGVRGLSSTLVEQDGADVLLTFRMEAGTSARVEQNFNRLEVIFARAGAAQTSQYDDERLRQVLKRVEELEARVKELEAKQQTAAANTNEAHAPSDEHAPSDSHASAGAASAVGATPTTAAHDSGKGSARGQTDDDMHASADHAEGLPTGTPRMQIQGYADVNLRASSERGRTTSFALGQIDLFITSRLSENFTVLGELILEAGEDNSFAFSAHRLLLRYAPRDYFALDVGRDHTAIGFYNTAYHHGSWFQTAATRPYLFAFENKGGPLPLHNVGVSVSGRIPSAPFGLRYVAQIGNGRSVNAATDRSVATAADENNGKAFNLALVARPPRLPGLQAGFSVYRDRRTPAGAPAVGETIMAAHLVRRTSRSELLNEGVLVRHAQGARVFYTPGFYTQFARRFGNARPYFRYQYVNAPDDDPVFRALEVGRRNGPAAGLRYDVSEFAAFKMQFERTQRRRKEAHDELILQLAFTF